MREKINSLFMLVTLATPITLVSPVTPVTQATLITTTSKGIFQFLAGVSFVFVVWNPIFCMVFPVHIVLNIGGFQV